MKTNKILKSLRQSQNLTQSEAAKLFDVSLSSYQKYERDKNSIMPSLEVLIRIADYYNVPIDFLLDRYYDKDDDEIKTLSAKYDISNLEAATLKNFMSLPKDIRNIIMKYLDAMINVETNNNTQNT